MVVCLNQSSTQNSQDTKAGNKIVEIVSLLSFCESVTVAVAVGGRGRRGGRGSSGDRMPGFDGGWRVKCVAILLSVCEFAAKFGQL